jgi:uncharacterized protein
MKSWPILPSVIAAALLAGCSTTTTMHYDLKSDQPNAAGQTAASQTVTSPRAIQYRVTSLEVPESIDVETLIVRQPDNTLMMLSHDKWVGSLSEAMRNAINASLAKDMGLPPLPASMVSAQQSTNVANIAIKVEHFDLQPAKQAGLSVLWQVTLPGKERHTVTCYSTWTETVGPGVTALVSAQQRNVQQLASQLAATLKSGKPPTTGNCQVGKA